MQDTSSAGRKPFLARHHLPGALEAVVSRAGAYWPRNSAMLVVNDLPRRDAAQFMGDLLQDDSSQEVSTHRLVRAGYDAIGKVCDILPEGFPVLSLIPYVGS